LPELDGCGAVVTGAGRGLGRGIALSLAARGARVVALDVNGAGADETAQLIGRAGGTSWPAQMDVTDEAEVQVKYQEMLETEAHERERLANQVRARTKELLETNQLLLKTQKELLAYKKGLTV